MRLKKKTMQTLQLHKKSSDRDEEGNSFPSFSDIAIDVCVEVWPATGKLQVEMYGQRVVSIMNMLSDSVTAIEIGDGIAYRSETPNYKVISKKNYTHHSVYEIEKYE